MTILELHYDYSRADYSREQFCQVIIALKVFQLSSNVKPYPTVILKLFSCNR